MENGSVTLKCPATSANLGSGYDICGIALKAPSEILELSISQECEHPLPCGITIQNGGRFEVPSEDNGNSVFCPVVKKMREDFGFSEKLKIRIEKNIKPASGLGSSAASSAGIAVAINELFHLKLSDEELISYASLGEAVAAGVPHLDNIAPAICGGFTAVYKENPVSLLKLKPPANLECLVILPHHEKKSTAHAREILPKTISREDALYNSKKLSALLAGFMNKDSQCIINALDDRIVESARENAGILLRISLLKKIGMKLGYGAAASGAGPALIALGEKNNPKKKEFEEKARALYSIQDEKERAFWTEISEKGIEIVK